MLDQREPSEVIRVSDERLKVESSLIVRLPNLSNANVLVKVVRQEDGQLEYDLNRQVNKAQSE